MAVDNLKYKNKYIKYKNKYLELSINKKITNYIYDQLGGSSYSYNIYDFKSVMKYINDRFNDTMNNNNNTKNKYFVVLYGPPSSGKTFAEKVAYMLINDIEKQNNINFIKNTFIHTNVDELIYDLCNISTLNTSCEKISNILKSNIDNFNKINTDNISIQQLSTKQIQDYIEKYEKQNMDAYNNKFQLVSHLSSFLLYFSIYLGKNIFFETSGKSLDYLYQIIDEMIKYNYIPIIVYPVINDPNVLYKRIYDRMLKEGRSVNKTYMDETIQNAPINFLKFFDKYKIKNNVIIYSYDANINITDYNELSSNEKLDEFKSKLKKYELINIK